MAGLGGDWRALLCILAFPCASVRLPLPPASWVWLCVPVSGACACGWVGVRKIKTRGRERMIMIASTCVRGEEVGGSLRSSLYFGRNEPIRKIE